MDRDLMDLALLILVLQTGHVASNHFHNEPDCNRSMVIAISGFAQLKRVDYEHEVVHDFTPASIILTSPMAVSADQQNGFVFFSDTVLRRVYRADFKTTFDTVIIKHTEFDSIVEAIATDTSNQRLFYSDYRDNGGNDSYIRSMDYSGGSETIVLSQADNLHRPRALIVNSEERMLYFTNVGDSPYIAKTDYAGSNIQILENDGLDSPNGLTADFANNVLYWCDGGLNSVNVISTDGHDRRTLFHLPIGNSGFYFFDIMLSHEVLYVSNWNGQYGVVSMDLNGHDVTDYLSITSDVQQNPNRMTEICFPNTIATLTSTTAFTTTPVSTTASTTARASITPRSTTSSTALTRSTSLTATSSTSSTTTSTTHTSALFSSVPTAMSTIAIIPSHQKTSEKDKSKSVVNMLLLIGVLLAALAVILVTTGVTLCCCVRKKKQLDGERRDAIYVQESINGYSSAQESSFDPYPSPYTYIDHMDVKITPQP